MAIIRNIVIILSLIGFAPLQAQTQKGKATFYSKRSTGARTASGERLHHDSLTCAHRTYPFGTMLKVTNLDNNKWVVVKVTDRGPFSRGRIIDLSWRAAKELDILAKGVSMVKVERYQGDNILFRPTDGGNLPEIDFEMTDAANEFGESWPLRLERSDILETEAKKKPAAKTATTGKHPTAKPDNKQHKNHRTTEKKESSSTWSNMLKGIKKKTEEIF